jgi:hypothetical protein
MQDNVDSATRILHIFVCGKLEIGIHSIAARAVEGGPSGETGHRACYPAIAELRPTGGAIYRDLLSVATPQECSFTHAALRAATPFRSTSSQQIAEKSIQIVIQIPIWGGEVESVG